MLSSEFLNLTLTSLKTVNTDLCLFERYTFTKTVNQDLSNNDINSTGLELVKGFQVIGDKDARKLQTTKIYYKGRCNFSFSIISCRSNQADLLPKIRVYKTYLIF